jgi:hypothetical protein
MKLTKEQYLSKLQTLIGDNTDDEALTVLEDFTDTYNEMENAIIMTVRTGNKSSKKMTKRGKRNIVIDFLIHNQKRKSSKKNKRKKKKLLLFQIYSNKKGGIKHANNSKDCHIDKFKRRYFKRYQK